MTDCVEDPGYKWDPSRAKGERTFEKAYNVWEAWVIRSEEIEDVKGTIGLSDAIKVLQDWGWTVIEPDPPLVRVDVFDNEGHFVGSVDRLADVMQDTRTGALVLRKSDESR